MTTVDTVRVGDEGTVFEMTIYEAGTTSPVNISSATVKQIIFTKPNDDVVPKTAVFTTDGTDGKIQYTVQANDLDMAGYWDIQGYIESSSGKWHTTISSFKVEDNL